MNDERIITLEDMPGWDKYTAIIKPDTSTTSIATTPRMAETATTVGIFDMNGHYLGISMRELPQGHYVVRRKIQGHIVNTVYLKK